MFELEMAKHEADPRWAKMTEAQRDKLRAIVRYRVEVAPVRRAEEKALGIRRTSDRAIVRDMGGR